MLTIILIALVMLVLYLSISWYFIKPEVRNSTHVKSTESILRFPKSTHRSNIVKVRIKGRFSRKVLRFRMRMMKGYKWGKLGLSAVSIAIKKAYRVILSRKVRKYYSKHYNIPFVVYRGN